MDMHVLGQGLQVAVLGLAGVFIVLILFYCATKVMLAFSRKSAKKGQ